MSIYNVQTDKKLEMSSLKNELLQTQQQQKQKCAALIHHHSERIIHETPVSSIVHARHIHVLLDGWLLAHLNEALDLYQYRPVQYTALCTASNTWSDDDFFFGIILSC